MLDAPLFALLHSNSVFFSHLITAIFNTQVSKWVERYKLRETWYVNLFNFPRRTLICLTHAQFASNVLFVLLFAADFCHIL